MQVLFVYQTPLHFRTFFPPSHLVCLQHRATGQNIVITNNFKAGYIFFLLIRFLEFYLESLLIN